MEKQNCVKFTIHLHEESQSENESKKTLYTASQITFIFIFYLILLQIIGGTRSCVQSMQNRSKTL